MYLIILDGFGLGKHDKGDAVFRAKKPFLDSLFKNNPFSKLKTHGRAVGLPEFQMGGSEVGHLTIGSGRRVPHILTIINDEIESGKFAKKPALKILFEKAKKKGRIHFAGLVSDGGIHSFLPHLLGLQKFAKKCGIKNVFVHAFLDGRDVPERTAKEYLAQIDAQKIGRIASLGGRFFSMDRDKNGERTKWAYDALCNPKVKVFSQSWRTYLDTFYATSEESDYYVPPVLFLPEGQLQPDDVLICFNFRTDRMRQICSAFLDAKFSEFPRPVRLDPKNVGVFGNYFPAAHTIYSLSDKKITHTLGEIISRKKLPQLRIAETEKFNHVTTFFSGDHKEPFPGEDRILVPSPKCPSYAEKPEMSAAKLTTAAIAAIQKKAYALVVHNYANGDLVGHSADIRAGIKAVETLDHSLAKLIPTLQRKGYDIIVTADHGNCEEMLYPDGSPSPAHSKNPVPFVLLSDRVRKLRASGELRDVAPTILQLLALPKPKEMTGESLIQK